MKIKQAPVGMPKTPPKPATLRPPVLGLPEPVEGASEVDLGISILGVFNDKLASQLSFQQGAASIPSAPLTISAWSSVATPAPNLVSAKAGLEFATSALSAYAPSDSGPETLGAAGAAVLGWWNYFERSRSGQLTPAEQVSAALAPSLSTLSVAMTCIGFASTAHWLSTGANVCNVVNVGFQMAHTPK